MPGQTQPNTMSLFRRVHIRTVPSEFLDPGSQPIQLRFCQLNAKKMAKADLADTLAAIEQLNQIMASMSDEDRAVALDRQEARRVESPQDTAAPNTFADYDNTTLIALAHVERRADDGSEWIELTTTEIDDFTLRRVASWRNLRCEQAQIRRGAACRETRYVSEVCLRCGERLPEKRNKHRQFCNKRCQNSAWKAADRRRARQRRLTA